MSNSAKEQEAAEADAGDSDPLLLWPTWSSADTWPFGRVVTQGCHAAAAAIWAVGHRGLPLRLHAQVTLEVKGEAQMRNLSEKLMAGGIEHKLWIEQPENMHTCIATRPCPKSQVASFFKKLKLCK